MKPTRYQATPAKATNSTTMMVIASWVLRCTVLELRG
jgi:hypothetical protein